MVLKIAQELVEKQADLYSIRTLTDVSMDAEGKLILLISINIDFKTLSLSAGFIVQRLMV